MSQNQKQSVEGWKIEILKMFEQGTHANEMINFFTKILSQQQLEILEVVKEIIEENHQNERLELLNSDNKSSTKEIIQKGFEIYKRKLLQSLSTLNINK